jgi:hypothetical protein
MKKINIINQPSIFIEVDDEDFDRLNAFRWRLCKRPATNYAMRIVPKKEQRLLSHPTGIYLHREAMGVILQKDLLIDHIDGNGLNNQKSNLRICKPNENQGNRRKISKCSSIYKGVFFNNRYQFWQAHIKKDGKRIYIGKFSNEVDAAIAYNEQAKIVFGEFANINTIKVA